MSREPSSPTARRPLRPQGRRALSNVGGATERDGDPRLCQLLARAFAVTPGRGDAGLTHPFHAYPARLHPQIARELVRASGAASPKTTVLDPFCGSGTVLIEAQAAGARVIGRDLSPLAVALSRVKLFRATPEHCRTLIRTAENLANTVSGRLRDGEQRWIPHGEQRWYPPHTLRELSLLLAAVNRVQEPWLRDACRMLFSSILVKVSLQATDSVTKRTEKVIAPGAALHWFARKSQELSDGWAALARAVAPSTPLADLHEDDATKLDSVASGVADVLVTSPPYANTYDYAAHHARRYAWLELDSEGIEVGEMGGRRWFRDPALGLARFERELAGMCTAFARVLAPQGRAFVIMADGVVGEEALRAERALGTAARHAGLRVVARVSQARPAFDPLSERAFRKHPKREHLVVLEKRESPQAVGAPSET